ncbi:heavy metal translocating P-type ATPase [Salinibacterium soli]|uniref:Heavy metal translocating P-type ATPase n=1 Tax=Antiquaquibacter soli TaxID=3064523 RepID=A0ABT9BSK7_9MICO|nr:heavy metal translocating P-type ATPase [Protaetiibacter sp. WY-16]MDO7882776.1 heavy metal translocating P-type ATPase [Protaetiibacter sp. WY-16]
MSEARPLALRYPWVLATIVVAAVAGILLLGPAAPASRWVATAFAATVAARSLWSMVQELRRGTWGVDILAVTAIASTLLLGDYWAALVVVLMLTGGEALEDYAAHRARGELDALLARSPRQAHRESRPGVTDDVAVADVRSGDLLEVRPGEVVPVDGSIVGEGAEFDESSLTGESLPVWHGDGAAVMSGSVNSGGVIRLRATATAAESQYQSIVALVAAAAGSKAPFVRLADRVAIPFTIVAFLIGGVAWAVSGEAARFAEVLVLATPCPLLIAAPVAFIAAMSRAAGLGVIVKNGGVIERLSRIRTVATDKTGTLTRGQPEVSRVEGLVGSEDDVLRCAASLEGDSAHVLARAVVEEASARGIPVPVAEGVQEEVAHGVRGVVDGRPCAVGRPGFVAPGAVAEWPTPLQPGETAVSVAVDGRLIGRVVLTDRLRPEAADTLRSLRALGVGRIVLLSGDAQETAERIGEEVGADEVHGGLLPADKVARVAALQPRPVMMIGDGVNDAPVLAAAEVGVAMGARGATAASESADAVVLVEDLSRVPDVILLSRRTIRIAQQSIGVGIGLSVAFMLVAAFGFVPAIVGAAIQEGIDVIAILNGLRAGVRGRRR